MRSPDGGELPAAEGARREQARFAATELIEAGASEPGAWRLWFGCHGVPGRGRYQATVAVTAAASGGPAPPKGAPHFLAPRPHARSHAEGCPGSPPRPRRAQAPRGPASRGGGGAGGAWGGAGRSGVRAARVRPLTVVAASGGSSVIGLPPVGP